VVTGRHPREEVMNFVTVVNTSKVDTNKVDIICMEMSDNSRGDIVYEQGVKKLTVIEDLTSRTFTGRTFSLSNLHNAYEQYGSLQGNSAHRFINI